MNKPYTFCRSRRLLGLVGGFGLLIWLGVTPVAAQRKDTKPDTEAGKAASGTTTLAKAEEELLFTEGMRHLMTDEPARAITQFEKLLQKNPNNAAAQYATANALLKTGKTAEAIPFASKAHSIDVNNKFYTLLLAELLVKQKRYGEAEELYEQLLSKGTENAEYGVELAAIYLFDDKPDKALDAYNRVERVLGMNEEITRQKQRIYLKQNKIDKAIEEAEKLVASEPGEPEYLLEGAELLIAHDRDDQAINWLDKALKLNPDLPQAHVLLADVYRKKGDMARVTKELNQVFANPNLEAGLKARILSSYAGATGESTAAQQDALKMAQDLAKTSPNDPKTQIMLGDLLTQQGKKAEARDAYAKAARLDGSTYEVWGALLQLDSELNQVDSLLVHSQQALEVFPTQGFFWYSNGSAHLFKRHYQEAVDALEESRKLLSVTNNAELVKGINAQLGDAYNGLGDHAKSDEAYELVLKEDPQNDHVLNNYSYFLSLRKENLPKALQMSKKLVERNPTNATFVDTHAWVLYTMKDYAKARQMLEKVIQANPASVSGTILEHYGDVLFQLGEREKALDQWKKAKAKGETSDALDKKIATGKL
ncbi:Tetratricopeptide TPR_2 repeat protein [Fibrisoma limi BUZ 3]|uniref:Tetratricopeptide TPR_2 repeat protein n=1 Tax=Fibrisoma limi BUZ 3 TaxID=1185876 RepID=I2GQ96_9BACT|nr:tetratricopeptide repeat protein [Fibrisoma limi]CCH56074.1 Tetratricopeptide TPR_2 repeat protein [Fibrisoma limi BUZ 3]